MMDHPKSGLPDFGRIRCASRINPTYVVKPGGDACGPHPASRRTQRRLARSYGAGPTGPRPMLKAPMLLAAVLVVCVASSADARRRHHHGYYDYGESVSTRDDGRRARDAQGQGQDRGQGGGQDQTQGQQQDQRQDQAQDQNQNRARDSVQDRRDYRGREGGDRRRARSLDEWRRSRETQNQGQDSGQDRGQALARDRGEDRTRESYDRRRARYDEWRRGRDRDDWRRSRDREDGARRREAARSDAVMRPGRGGPFAAVVEKLVRGCGQQGAEFENWPFDAIAQIVGADEAQRRALEGLRESAKAAAERLAADCPRAGPAAPSARLEAGEQGIDAAPAAVDPVQPALATFYRALHHPQKPRLSPHIAAPPPPPPPLRPAAARGGAAPAERALPPVGRMDAMRQRLAAVRAATAAIRPALVHFYEALDQGQKVRFAGMS